MPRSRPPARQDEAGRRLVEQRPGRVHRYHPFVAQANPDAAERLADTINRIVANLGDMATGRPGRVTDTYETVVPGLPYIIAYAVDDQPGRSRIAVLHIIHGARDWPDEDWPASKP